MEFLKTDGTLPDIETVVKRPCALLWDESFLWGVMTRRALTEAGVSFDPVRAADIREGALSRYRMLFVPGGWASGKIAALGAEGAEAIRSFVAAGGNYLGICGGAGMATESGLGLLPVQRRPSSERVPSFSGRIRLSCVGHGMWQSMKSPIFCAWWPSQFRIVGRDVRLLARYEAPLPDAFGSDIPVADGEIRGWPDLERLYGILLDPARLSGEPAVVEGSFGRGKVVLSLVHFDTPGDKDGSTVLRNLWRWLSGAEAQPRSEGGGGQHPSRPALSKGVLEPMAAIREAVHELIAVGERNFLWYWRTDLLLQWRRGIRGLEYATLAAVTGEIGRCLGLPAAPRPVCPPNLPESVDFQRLEADLGEIRGQLIPFVDKAKHLLIRERFAMPGAPLSPLVSEDATIGRLREELFGTAMSHGGDFKRLIDRLDDLLYRLTR